MMRQVTFAATLSVAAAPVCAETLGECLSLRTIAKFDKDRSFSIDRQEFQAIAVLRFDTADTDKDGIVSLSDLPKGKKYHPSVRKHANRDAARGEWMDKPLFLRSLDGFFAFVDRNNNQKLSLGEYNRLCRSGYLF